MTQITGLDPSSTSICMKCRRTASRYYGKWAQEGLCRPCVLAMSPDIRLKVLRDMHPEDRKRWQLDSLTEGPPDAGQKLPRGSSEPAEETVRALLDAAESGREDDFRARMAEASAVAPEPAPPPTPQRRERPERREHPRLESEIPLRFRVAGSAPGAPRPTGDIFHGVAENVSPGGMKVLVEDEALPRLPAGSALDLEVLFPPPFGLFKCAARVASVVRGATGSGAGHLCVSYTELRAGPRVLLNKYLLSRTASPPPKEP